MPKQKPIMTLRNLINIFVGLLACLTIKGQTLTERLILTDTKDSIYLNADKISFDQEGNYCFIVEIEDREYFITNKDTIGGFKFIGSTFSNRGGIKYTNSLFQNGRYHLFVSRRKINFQSYSQ